ncbi:transcriptional regulator [Caulobacter sp. CCUG 60055]|uniref:winged helix-turn-helix transcriptional regulator n=1 Tax=Caulobacter sp. CCUG 60055 TaxID=2100090 RepID=UPI000EAC0541|nr:winged helix-turn-helix transcriptional regulator [Caulobacter sp. CCUG 60055]MCI3181283.1 transcriptional regulator [Caulobacter sp. CCUG 60055]
MKIPQIGAPVRGSSTGRPVMVLLDLLGRRMTLRVLWELRGGPLTFRALQDAAETNPAVLNTRLHELRGAGLVAHDGGGYRLTEDGAALLDLLLPLVDWSEGWSRRLETVLTPAGRE